MRVIEVGELEIRPEEHLATVRGRTLVLSGREVGVLAALAERTGHVVRRADLYREVWGGDLRPDDRSVDVYVHKVRTKLEEALPEWRFIHTHFGLGYRFAPELSQQFHRPTN